MICRRACPERVDDLRVLALLGREVGVLQEAGHADHAVHGGADLVAHVGHELGLEAEGLLGLAAGRDEHVDVLGHGGHALDTPLGVAPGVGGEAHEGPRAVAQLHLVLGQ